MKLLATLLLVVGSLIPAFGAPPPPVRYTDLTTNSVPRASGVLTNDGGGHVGWTTGFTGGTVTITNLYSGTAFLTNATIQNLYVTQQIISSNTVSGNIQGTVGMLPIFGPTEFDLADSGLHKTDTNTYVFDGTGDASVQLFGTAPQIVFGTGGTNILYRTASSLIYAVDGHDLLTVLPNGAFQTALRGNDNTGVFLTSNNLVPEVDNGTSLGGDGVSSWWHNLGLKGSEWISGFLSGTNYSRVEIKHTGTNGAIVFDSQSAGTAGPARPFNFSSNGVVIASVANDPIYEGNSFNLFNGGGDNAKYAVDAAGSPVITTSAAFQPVKLFAGGAAGGLFVNIDSIQPGLDGISIGYNSVNGGWVNEWLKGKLYVQGFRDSGDLNYSRLEIFHEGTNSVSVLDSQSGGTAGNPRELQLRFGGTNNFAFSPDGWFHLAKGITKAEKSAITATNGMIVYQTDNTPGLRAYIGGAWVILQTAADP